MKAVVLRGKRDIQVEKVPEVSIGPEDVLVKIKECGICGTDIHYFRSGISRGQILGHEFSGDVIETGANVRDIGIGDRVIGAGYCSCGTCSWCQQGLFHKCSNIKLIGKDLPGAMAEYVLIPEHGRDKKIYRLPDSMTYEDGTTVEPLSIAWLAEKKARVEPDNTVAVIGCGMIGLCIIQLLRAHGVTNIIACERRSARLQIALEYGASLVLDSSRKDFDVVIKEATSGLGADVVFECARTKSSFAQAHNMLRKNGKIVMAALYDLPLTWSPLMPDEKNATLIGVQRGCFTEALRLLQEGEISTRKLVSHRFPLEDTQRAFEVQDNSEDAVKVVVKI